MSQSEVQSDDRGAETVTIRDVLVKMRNGLRYLKRRAVFLLVSAVLGGLIGVAYSVFSKPKYSAVCTFVLDEGSRTSGLGQYASLASLAGLNLGEGGSDGIFQGDNIIDLYKSRLMIEEALLTPVNINGKNETLIERFIGFNHLRPGWKKKDKIDTINFVGNPASFNRIQDSIMSKIVESFGKNVLDVTRPDKKLALIRVEVTSKDELFAREFTNTLVSTVNDYYIKTTTKKYAQNVQILQRQADSIRSVLNSSITGVASAIEADPNANPALLSLRVPSQKKQVDVQASAAMYTQIVQNLELAKIGLMQSTPLIQVIDQPVYPLDKIHTGILKGFVLGSFIFLFLAVVLLVLIRLYKISLSVS